MIGIIKKTLKVQKNIDQRSKTTNHVKPLKFFSLHEQLYKDYVF